MASSDAVEAGVEWADEEEEEEEAGEAFDEEAGEVEEEVLASGDEGEGEYAAVEPLEEAKVYVGNLPVTSTARDLRSSSTRPASLRSPR